jgi:hypothetical protein
MAQKRLVEEQAKKKPTPGNLDILEVQERFKTEFPAVMKEGQTKIREFILRELLPFSLAMQNGSIDAFDAASRALDVEVPSDTFNNALRSVVLDSINIKLLSFIMNIANLNPVESQLLIGNYLLRNHPSGTQNVIEQILSSLRELPELQRQTQKRELPLRALQELQGGRQPDRPVQPEAGSGRERPQRKAQRGRAGARKGNRGVRGRRS